MHYHQLLLCSFLYLLSIGLLSAQAEQVNLEVLQKEVSISGPAIAPDGRRAVCITSQPDFANNSYQRQLLLIDVRTKEQRVLSTRAGIAQPAWAPDGKHLAFLASGEEGRQIYLLPTDGGEAFPITQSRGSIRRFAWSPDGAYLAFVADAVVPPKTGPDRFNRSFEVGSDDFLTTAPAVRKTVWVTDRSGREARQLTPPETTVGTNLSLSDLQWSPDGKQLTFTVFPTPAPGDSDLGRAAVYDLERDTMKWVTGNEMREAASSFVPASAQMAYLYPRDGVPSNLRELYLTNPETQSATSWTRVLDRHVRSYRWLNDASLLITASDGLKTGMWHSPEPGEFAALPMGEVVSIGAFDHTASGGVLFVGTQTYHPDELYFKPALKAEPIQLTNFNAAIANCKQGKMEGLEWESTDALRPNGVITYPPDFDSGKKYPLVLLIHGGPTASSKLDFSARAQLMAARGWIVFQPNYRGSDNLGNALQSAIANDAAQGPGEDVITGVRTLQEESYIDSDKIAVSGWSYGGWMTAWLIGRYPKVWTAAVAGAAPVDYTDMYSLNDLNRMRRHAITVSPYVGDNLEKAYAQSPIVHFSKLQTPTLILSVTGDYRVTITGSYKLYGALRDNNVPVQFIAYPGRGHYPRDPVQQQDVMRRWLGWLEQYLGA